MSENEQIIARNEMLKQIFGMSNYRVQLTRNCTLDIVLNGHVADDEWVSRPDAIAVELPPSIEDKRVLITILQACYDAGREDGRADLQKNLKNLLGL